MRSARGVRESVKRIGWVPCAQKWQRYHCWWRALDPDWGVYYIQKWSLTWGTRLEFQSTSIFFGSAKDGILTWATKETILILKKIMHIRLVAKWNIVESPENISPPKKNKWNRVRVSSKAGSDSCPWALKRIVLFLILFASFPPRCLAAISAAEAKKVWNAVSPPRIKNGNPSRASKLTSSF